MRFEDLAGLSLKEKIHKLKEEEYTELYNDDFMRFERVGMDFQEKIKVMDDNETGNLYWWVLAKMRGKCLDVGCGFGILAHYAVNKGLDYTGVDVSDKAIKKAQESVPKGKFQVGFAEKLPFKDNEFDTVVGTEIIEHVKNDKEVIKEIFRVCKPGGRVILTTPKESMLQDRMHVREYNYYDIVRLIKEFTDDFTLSNINKFYNSLPNDRLLLNSKVMEVKTNVFAIIAKKEG